MGVCKRELEGLGLCQLTEESIVGISLGSPGCSQELCCIEEFPEQPPVVTERQQTLNLLLLFGNVTMPR